MAVYLRGKIYYTNFKLNGKQIRRRTGATTKREAERAERAIRLELEQAANKAYSKNYSYEDAVLKWAKTGPKSMLSHARNTRPYLDHVPLSKVVPVAHDMRDSMLSEGYSPQTINRRLAVVRRILNMAYKEWEWIDRPLGDKVKLLSEKGYARELYLSKDEVRALVDLIEDENIRNLVLVAAFTGLRQGELRGLTRDNWQPPYIILGSKTKSKKPRTIPVITELHEVMDAVNFAVSEWEIRKHFEAARDAMKRPDIRFHDLRHTFASWLAADPKIPLTLIRDILGHSSLIVTDKYAHLRGASVDQVTDALSMKGVTKSVTSKNGENEHDSKLH